MSKEEERRELRQVCGGHRLAELRRQHPEDDNGDYPSDGDDAHTLATVTSHELERVEKEDGGQLSSEEEEQRRSRDELTRPRTPEPTGLGMTMKTIRPAVDQGPHLLHCRIILRVCPLHLQRH